MASWPEGDGAGMSTGSCWPDASVSAQVVDVSRRGGISARERVPMYVWTRLCAQSHVVVQALNHEYMILNHNLCP